MGVKFKNNVRSALDTAISASDLGLAVTLVTARYSLQQVQAITFT